ncbi:MAG: hypothetical protein KJO07_16480, partial [Deltaproteobacteria bacterium]|nr:hypothetical protein [Deltaproteobacteria bacterium]
LAFALGCKKNEGGEEGTAASKPTEEAKSADDKPADDKPADKPAADDAKASPESVFRDKIAAFAQSGKTELYVELLSKRMKDRLADREKNDDAKKDLAAMAKQMGLPESATFADVMAKTWHKGMEPVADKLGAAEVVIKEDGDRKRAHFENVDLGGKPMVITVAIEDGAIKIDEN